MNDLQLKQAVSDELEFDPAFDGSHIGVFVSDRVVTLSGWVDDFAQKHAAAEAVRRVRGVRALALELEVRFAADKKLSDDEIAARAAKIIEWDLRLPQGAITVTVDNGVVELRGQVAWAFIRREAEADVRKLGGVLGVRNHIVVQPSIEQASVQGHIEAAFKRAADLQAEQILVQLESGDTVVLTGRVGSLNESALAENAAWSAPGVVQVINRIEVAV